MHFYVFSKNGFTERCIKNAGKNKNVKLVKFDEMM